MEHTVTKKYSSDAQFTNKPKICQDFVAFVYQIISQHDFFLFPILAVFARIKADILGERQNILFLTSGASRPESKSYKFPWTPGPMPAVNVVKINRI